MVNDIVPRLRDWLDEDKPIGVIMTEAADTITALRAREADLTLEGLAHIGRLEAVREVLAGTDIGSLPKDYPTLQMVQDRMAELAALRAENEKLRAALKNVYDDHGYGLPPDTKAMIRAALGEYA